MFMQFFIERAQVVTSKRKSAYLYFAGGDYFKSEYANGLIQEIIRFRKTNALIQAARSKGASPQTGIHD